MARKGKDKGTLLVPPPVRPPDMSPEARRERLLGLGMTAEEIDRQFAVTAKTTLCSEHVRSLLKPGECAKCGLPMPVFEPSDEWKDISDAARASEERMPIDEMIADDTIRVEGPRQLTAEEVAAAYLTPEEREAPFAAVLTEDQLAALFDAPVPIPPAPRPGSGFDVILVGIKPIWHQRAKTMAEVDGFDVPDFIERLIKRQWIASGGGKR